MLVQPLDMTPEEARLAQTAFTYLRAHIDAAQRFRQEAAPAASSPWLTDQYLPFANDGQSIVHLSLMAAHFYLSAVARVMESGGLDPISGYALLRGAGEASARAWWLLDPNLGGESRRDRGLTDRLSNILEVSKASGGDKTRLRHLLSTTSAAGIRALHDRRGQAIGFGNPRPEATKLFETVAASTGVKMPTGLGEVIFRYLSGHTHSMPWALLSDAASWDSGQAGISIARIELHLPLFVICIELVIAMFEAAQERYARLIDRLSQWQSQLHRLPSPQILRAVGPA